MFHQTYRAGAKGSEPERDTVAWYQKRYKKVRRGLCLRNEVSIKGNGQSQVAQPEGDPVANIEWKSRLSVNEKEDLLQEEDNKSVEFGAGVG